LRRIGAAGGRYGSAGAVTTHQRRGRSAAAPRGQGPEPAAAEPLLCGAAQQAREREKPYLTELQAKAKDLEQRISTI